MKIVHLPDRPRALVFDIDQTLYDHSAYAEAQTRLLVARLATHLGQSVVDVTQTIQDIRASLARANAGQRLSLGNAFLHLGVSIATSVQWRQELFIPEHYLTRDAQLATTLARLSHAFLLSAVTNNPTSVGARTLAALGVRDYFPLVIGLDVTGTSKPTMEPFRLVSETQGVPLQAMISVGDRMEVDIAVPVQHGMGGILVEGVRDVYALPTVLGAWIQEA